MRVLSKHKSILILKCLVEGVGIRRAARVAEVSHPTVIRMALDAGRACAEYQSRMFRGLRCGRIDISAVWSFSSVPAKEFGRLNTLPHRPEDVWTWTGTCRDSELVLSWRVGDRSGKTAIALLEDLRERVAGHVRVAASPDGVHIEAVDAPAVDEDHRILTLHCRETETADFSPPYSRSRVGPRSQGGFPEPLSGKLRNHTDVLGLHFMHHNYCRVDSAAMKTPAMLSGATDHLWEVRDLAELVDAWRGRRRERRRETTRETPRAPNRLR